MEAPSPSRDSGPPYANEPPVLQRLPAGVEYTFVKMILGEVPGPLMTTPWVDSAASDEIATRFRSKTYGAVDRALRKAEADLRKLPLGEEADRRLHVQSLRHAWVQQAVGETGALKSGEARIVTTWTDPDRLGKRLTPTGLDGPGLVIEVVRTIRRRAWLLERWVLPAALMPWRPDSGVPWIDPDLVDQIYAVLIRIYFRPVLRKPVGQRWRSQREPAGWPVLTQYAIPALYDYLRPYDKVQPYHHRRQSRSDGHFPAALRRDITDLVKFECPHLAGALTVTRVTAVIQRYVRRTLPSRRMGIDLFKLTLPSTKSSRRKKSGRK